MSDSKGHTNPQGMNGRVKGRDRGTSGDERIGSNLGETLFSLQTDLVSGRIPVSRYRGISGNIPRGT